MRKKFKSMYKQGQGTIIFIRLALASSIYRKQFALAQIQNRAGKALGSDPGAGADPWNSRPPGIVGLRPPRFIWDLLYKSANRGGRLFRGSGRRSHPVTKRMNFFGASKQCPGASERRLM